VRFGANFLRNYSDFRAYEDSADVAQKKTKPKRKTGQNNPTGNLTFNEQKFQKN
jgi:ATP-binding cassette subfamily F protein uup